MRIVKALAACLAVAAAPLAAAHADTLTAGQAKTVVLADCFANLYYTVADGAYEVVTTVAPGPDAGGHPMRFVSRLADGERQEFSIGNYGDSTALRTLTVSRAGEQVSFEVGTRHVSRRQSVSANQDFGKRPISR